LSGPAARSRRRSSRASPRPERRRQRSRAGRRSWISRTPGAVRSAPARRGRSRPRAGPGSASTRRGRWAPRSVRPVARGRPGGPLRPRGSVMPTWSAAWRDSRTCPPPSGRSGPWRVRRAPPRRRCRSSPPASPTRSGSAPSRGVSCRRRRRAPASTGASSTRRGRMDAVSPSGSPRAISPRSSPTAVGAACCAPSPARSRQTICRRSSRSAL